MAKGSVYRKTVTRSVPKNATIEARRRKATAKELRYNSEAKDVIEQVAKWRDKTGEIVRSVVHERSDGSLVIRQKSDTYYIDYRDADGIKRVERTGFTELENAKTKLAEVRKEVERIQAGVLTTSELSTASASQSGIATHVDAYIDHLRHSSGKGKRQRISASHLYNVERSIKRIIADCQFTSLREISRDRVQRWVSEGLEDKTANWSNRTINSHVEGLKAFCFWCVDSAKPKRMMVNPLARFSMLDTENSQKRPRRALTTDELNRLLLVARLRPIAEYGRATIRKDADNQPDYSRSRSTWSKAELSIATIQAAYDRGKIALQNRPDKIEQLDRLGIERELLYLVLVTTGLRQGELASITVGQVCLDESPAWIDLSYRDEKAGRGASVPLRSDVADRLRSYLADRDNALASELVASGVVPMSPRSNRQKLDERLIPVPAKFVRILDRDLAAAGIPKIDEHGESVDVHAMRHTFSTMLHRAGVSPSVAQAAMRHSDIRLTMKTYNHLGLVDVSSAVESLPGFSTPNHNRTTGTDSSVAVTVAVASDLCSQNLSICGNSGDFADVSRIERKHEKSLDSQGNQGFLSVGVERFELPTLWSQTRCATRLRYTPSSIPNRDCSGSTNLADCPANCNVKFFFLADQAIKKLAK